MTAELTEMLEAALSTLKDGIAVLDNESRVLFWNTAADAITGYRSAELLSRTLPNGFYQVEVHPRSSNQSNPERLTDPGEQPSLVNLHHSHGHSLPAMLRRIPLRDALGKRLGTLLRFHPVEEIDALPHGHAEEDDGHENRMEQSQADMEDRLDEAWHEWTTSAVPFGLLWITVDQAAMLRKTHGRDASEAMLNIVERTLLHALRPTEILGRWGTNEFLVLCHERTAEMLEAHAHHVGGLARTADFRWWGDRVNLTVSIGAAQAAIPRRGLATGDGSLRCLLQQAQEGMQESVHAGGNRVVIKETIQERLDIGGQECSQL
jgi:PAS domain S-box-containing protein/diguanylate cyclase (GGDEF)-like protein